MCRVTLGKPVEQYNAIKIAHAPPGHHSVIGRPSTGGLNYPEYAIYRGEQVCDIPLERFGSLARLIIVDSMITCYLYY